MAINGYTIVAVATPNVDLPIEQIPINLHYDPQEGDGDLIAADPPVALNNTNAAHTAWPTTTARNSQWIGSPRKASSYPHRTRAISPWPIARGPRRKR